MQEIENGVSLEPKSVNDIIGTFFVPSYQRGYRWTESQVKTLVSDLYENVTSNKDYCLQPIVVRKCPDKSKGDFELVDGQQRLTTIFILLLYLKNHYVAWAQSKFSLNYETRVNTSAFLKDMKPELANTNVDFYHIYMAYRHIDDWFSLRPEFHGDLGLIGAAQNKLYTYIVDHAKVIWYECSESEDPVKLFTRLNIGRIKLTNAELVKALLLKSSIGADHERRRLEIAMQWDNMEKQLCSGEDELWYFLTRESPERYPTRIEFLFDLMARKDPCERDEYFTFFYFEKQLSRESVEQLWEAIVNNFLRLKEWFEDKEFYHLIGYLISSGSATMSEIFGLATDKRKSEFRKAIKSKIRNSLTTDLGMDLEYDNLSYERNGDKPVISKLLLLFNVLSILKEDVYQRFPFSKCNKSEWSLEHIHAQQSQGLKTAEHRREWLKMHLDSLRTIFASNENTELIEEVEHACNSESELAKDRFEDLFTRVTSKLSEDGDLDYIHSLSNMALLKKSDNSALNNSTFDVKRNKIIEMDQKGEFIPYCTKMVFLKYYTNSGATQIHFWGAKDREAYLDAINRILKPYLEI